eukprot:TRINITY_DN26067_c0_g1_i2.p1 TRINITY_DN26067_c0_g1~~TRINITY_DN26067_c0_g1_i2.p1  ORF type:complete len:247 (+),score=45.91 TRINITY_DN26067_c0_g1_i2:19-759(+)
MSLQCESDDDIRDPEPACPPPPWAAEIISSAKALVGLEVYPPSDDTFLLLEALATDAHRLQVLRPSICLEIGCGSGAVSAGLWEVLRGHAGGSTDLAPRKGPLLLAVDKNPAAVACTASLLRNRAVPLPECVRSSLTSSLRLAGSVDIVICNPPYVPTEDEEEMQGTGISVSWAGGARGREIIDVLLPQVSELLAPGGLFYLVCIAENEPEEIMCNARGLGMGASLARREERGMEELSILRFEKPR